MSFSPKFRRKSSDSSQGQSTTVTGLSQEKTSISYSPKMRKLTPEEKNVGSHDLFWHNSQSSSQNNIVPSRLSTPVRRNLSGSFTQSSMTSSTLSPDQKARMESNRLKALAKKNPLSQVSNPCSPSQRAEQNHVKALESHNQILASNTVSQKRTEHEKNNTELNNRKTSLLLGEKQAPDPSSIPYIDKVVGLTVSERKRIEDNRLKALQRKKSASNITTSPMASPRKTPIKNNTSFSPRFRQKTPECSQGQSTTVTGLSQEKTSISYSPKMRKYTPEEKNVGSHDLFWNHSQSSSQNNIVPSQLSTPVRRNLSSSFTQSSTITSSSLTPDQKARMEANRLKALAKKNPLSQVSNPCSPSQRAEQNRLKALERLKQIQEESQSSQISLLSQSPSDRMKDSQEKPESSQISSSPVSLSSQSPRAERNRLKALEKRRRSQEKAQSSQTSSLPVSLSSQSPRAERNRLKALERRRRSQEKAQSSQTSKSSPILISSQSPKGYHSPPKQSNSLFVTIYMQKQPPKAALQNSCSSVF